jgi:WD40 repeat protein
MRVLKGHEDIVRCLSYSPDGKLLAAGDELNYIRLWSLPQGEEIDVLDRDAGSVEALAFSPSGKRLAAGLPDLLVVWDVESRKVVAEKTGHTGGTRGLSWHPDGKVFASCGWDRQVRFWTEDLATRWPALEMPEPMMALAFSSDGKTLACAGSSGTLLLLELNLSKRARFSGVPDSVVSKHQRGLFSLARTSDGRLLATGDAKGDVVLWEVGSDAPVRILQGHEWTVYGLAFTPNGQSLLSASADETVRLWEVSTGRLVETFRWHSRWVTSVVVSPDGMTAAAGSADGTIVVWDLADV